MERPLYSARLTLAMTLPKTAQPASEFYSSTVPFLSYDEWKHEGMQTNGPTYGADA